MLRRLYHFFVVGHAWELKYRVWNGYGFTDFHFAYSCGARKRLCIVGE